MFKTQERHGTTDVYMGCMTWSAEGERTVCIDSNRIVNITINKLLNQKELYINYIISVYNK